MTGFEVKGQAKERLELFFRFMAERQRIWERRRDGEAPPWTADPVLRDNKFTNIYRELDRGTVWWFQNVLGSLDTWDPAFHREAIWCSAIYRMVNRVDTFERMGAQRRRLAATHRRWFPARHPESVATWIRQFGLLAPPLFTGAHIIGFGAGMTKVQGLRRAMDQLLERLRTTEAAVLAAPTLREVCAELQKIEGIGGFISYEIACDLWYAGTFRGDESAWCNVGPGSEKGLAIVFEGQVDGLSTEGYMEGMRWVHRNQEELMRWCGVEDFPHWDGRHEHARSRSEPGRLSLRSVEHSLCEFQKYWRCLNGGRAKNRFSPSGRGM